MTTTVTKEQIKAGLELLQAVAAVVRESGPRGMSEGLIYSAMMAKLDLGTFQKMVQTLINAGVVRRENGALVWAVKEVA